MKKRRALRIARAVLVLVLAVGVAAVLIKLKPKPKKLPPPSAGLLVEVMPVKASSFAMTLKSYGTVRPREALDLISEVKGKVVGIAPEFEEGGFFQKGHLLIRIDPRSYELAAAQREKQRKQMDAELRLLGQERQNLQATLKIARTDLELAQAESDRFKKLIAQKVISQSSQDQAEQKYLAARSRMQEIENQLALIDPRAEQLKAQRELVEVQLQEALLDLDRTRIRAPFDGWVLEKKIERHQFVNAGTLWGRVYRASALEVEVRIPFKDLPWLGELPSGGNHSGPGQEKDLSGTAIRAKVLFESAGRTHTWDGRLARVKAEADEKTRTLPLVVEVPASDSAAHAPSPYSLKPGMFVKVELIGKRIDQAYLLPRSAVYPGDRVYLADDRRLVVRRVKVLRRLEESVYVSEGLKDGDLVITTPVSAPREGTALILRGVEPPRGS